MFLLWDIVYLFTFFICFEYNFFYFMIFVFQAFKLNIVNNGTVHSRQAEDKLFMIIMHLTKFYYRQITDAKGDLWDIFFKYLLIQENEVICI